ncbi:endonuclease V family protein, variant 2 [Capsaspora owczarzaki ATCC 30864]|uniref:Endonuclease V family protein, variant 1 n=1 Tax=Capsaspora owczarzaki (strain ATCC 30864) TaxID=595528 RepID=A0A0D2WXR7_CAPO3|nr:endonuclease V family protein, variant 1 [Capsaspora owczarzaki ATCC 30864]KJE98070.1 endonuclease V family protein, variant 2 [Capsaspora owczarzaki ATCC 30864]
MDGSLLECLNPLCLWGTESATDGLGLPPLRLVGGVDISFVKGDPKAACASLVVLSFPEMKVVYENFEMVELTLPYIPGFLAFREVNFLVALLDRLRAQQPELLPQLIFVDGNGVLHQRGFGLASHLGVLVDIPTIGIGKTIFHVDGIDMNHVKTMVVPKLSHSGATAKLVGISGREWGAALRSTEDSTNPVFISVGHRISLDHAIRITKTSCLHRIPEPVRQADLRSRQYLRDHPYSSGVAK